MVLVPALFEATDIKDSRLGNRATISSTRFSTSVVFTFMVIFLPWEEDDVESNKDNAWEIED